jgi:2-oxoacid:acceptor oxidoreductase gamma subunit (pyruvate/2-ketoisovalerate family)
MTEVRWHARAGQGAKTAAQLLAEALLRSGRWVQAFPEYGPERRGAPVRAYTRVADRPIRRHDTVTRPDVVAVLDPALVREVDVTEGLAPGGVVLVAAESPPGELGNARTICLAAPGNANVVVAAAVGALLGAREEDVVEAAVRLLGRKVSGDTLRSAVKEGYACLS